MIAGRKRGHVSLSSLQGCLNQSMVCFLCMVLLHYLLLLIDVVDLNKISGSRIVITVTCVPLVSGYVRPPNLSLPDVGESNISCNPAGPHLVCVLPPTLSSSYCIPA